nr:hypothetical protein [Tanacetum cinerariifolium]
MKDTMLELLEDCRQKELYCMHKDVEDLIESALNSKLLSINLKSQRLDKKKQESSISLNNTSPTSSVIAIIPVLPTEESDNSLSMGDEHLSTILEIESDKVIKSSVVNLVSIPSESEVTFDNEKIISTKIDPHHFNAESDLIKILLNRDTWIDSSPKFDYLLEELSGELAHIDPIPSGIKEGDFDLEEEIRLVKNLLYDNSSPRSPKELNVEIADTILESLSQSPISVEDSDPLMEEIDLLVATDDLMPSGIDDDPFPLLENESFNFYHHDDPSFPLPPPEPPDVEIFFDFEPDTGVLTASPMMLYGGDIPLLDVSFLHFYPP